VEVGDVLVAFWCVANVEDQFMALPAGWNERGRATARSSGAEPPFSGFWVGHRTVRTGESAATTYPFPTGTLIATHHAVFVAALRGARTSQPITPAVVQQTPGTQTALTVFDVPSFDAHGPSVALFAACSFGTPTLPEVSGFERLESSSSFALYSSKSPLSDGETAKGPHIEFPRLTSDPSPLFATASLAVVAQP
jgi:hypothetical protein